MAVRAGTILNSLQWLAKRFPATPLSQVTTLTYDELRSKYRWTDRWATLTGFLLFAGLLVGYYCLLAAIGDWLNGELDRAYFTVRFRFGEWQAMAFGLTLFSCPIIQLACLRIALGKSEFATYVVYVSYSAGPSKRFNAVVVFAWMFAIGVSLLATLAVCGLDYYTVFSDDRAIINPFWTVGSHREHPYDTIRGLYESHSHRAPAGQVQSINQVIVFDGNTRLMVHFGGAPLEKQRSVMKFIAMKSAKPYQVIERYEDIPP